MAHLSYYLLATLLLVSTFSQVEDIFSSTSDTVQIIEYKASDQPTFLTAPDILKLQTGDLTDFIKPSPLGAFSHWIYPKDQKGNIAIFPKAHWTLFSSRFHTSCPQKEATIYINALPWNYVVVVLNGHVLGKGWGAFQVSTKNCKECQSDPACSCLSCVCNNLDIYVWVSCESCPVAACFKVTQDIKNCFVCENKGSVYNYNTCRCECKGNCQRCTTLQIDKKSKCECSSNTFACTRNKWFNQQTCKCQCYQPFCCPRGQWRDPNSCVCIPREEIKSKAICTADICWNGDSRSPFDCGCPVNPDVDPTPDCAKAICPPPLSWSREKCACA